MSISDSENRKASHWIRADGAALMIFALLVGLALCSLAPFKHGPDANYYFGVALRVSQGRFLESVDGMYSPLLSWLMAIPAALGVSLTTSFRSVNFLAFGAVLFFVNQLCTALNIPPLYRSLALLMSALHLVYFTVGLPGADLLCAAFYSALAVQLIRISWRPTAVLLIGVFGAAAYYSKAIQLPIVLLALLTIGLLRVCCLPTQRWQTKRTMIAALICLGLSLPWIVTLSQKYHRPLISAQVLLNSEIVNSSGKPLRPMLVGFDPSFFDERSQATEKKLEANYAQLFQHRIDQIVYYAKTLTRVAELNYFGPDTWYVYLGVLLFGFAVAIVKFKADQIPLVLYILMFSHVLGYMFSWGPHVRYYLPVLPLMHVLFAYSAHFIESKFSSRLAFSSLWQRCGKTLFQILLVIILSQPLIWMSNSVALSLADTDQEVADFALALPEIRAGQGAVTGRFHDPYAGYLAYAQKREYWGSIDPLLKEAPATIRENLQHAKISQVYWFGALYEQLEGVKGLERHGPFEKNGVGFWVYDVR